MLRERRLIRRFARNEHTIYFQKLIENQHRTRDSQVKYWRGKKAYLDTISQLLGYLTWRDSKAAVVIFVKNKELSPVLNTVKDATPEHANYLGLVTEQEEGWYHYRFHINDDKNREVKLSVMLFHLPE